MYVYVIIFMYVVSHWLRFWVSLGSAVLLQSHFKSDTLLFGITTPMVASARDCRTNLYVRPSINDVILL